MSDHILNCCPQLQQRVRGGLLDPVLQGSDDATSFYADNRAVHTEAHCNVKVLYKSSLKLNT